MRIGITGSTSAIGRAVRLHAQESGHSVEELGRREGQRPFTLGYAFDPSIVDGLDAVIHLAWDRSLTAVAMGGEDANVSGSTQLFDACQQARIPVVFLSSSSARWPDRSRYGAAKLAAERSAEARGVTVFRAGLVWGGKAPPIIVTLDRLANLPGSLPLPTPPMVLDHNHQSHVARSLLGSVATPHVPVGSRSLASSEFITSTHVLRALRRRRGGLTVHVPSRIAAGAARRLRDSGLSTSERLDSISILDTTADDLESDPGYPPEFGANAFLGWLRTLQPS